MPSVTIPANPLDGCGQKARWFDQAALSRAVWVPHDMSVALSLSETPAPPPPTHPPHFQPHGTSPSLPPTSAFPSLNLQLMTSNLKTPKRTCRVSIVICVGALGE
jgi:hypothetical protein